MIATKTITGNGNVAAKTGNAYISGTMAYDRNSKRKSGVFDHAELGRQPEVAILGASLAISRCPSCRNHGYTYIEFDMVKNAGFAVAILRYLSQFWRCK